MADNQPTSGAVAGLRLVLRLEGLALLALTAGAYFWLGEPWWLFVVLFLAPDLSFLGYLAGPAVGAAAYNAANATIGPIVLLAFGLLAALPLAVSLALLRPFRGDPRRHLVARHRQGIARRRLRRPPVEEERKPRLMRPDACFLIEAARKSGGGRRGRLAGRIAHRRGCRLTR
jgi:hypothetical protein